jgi:lysophospholipase L1-like esterase
VINLARGGASSKTFLAQGFWAKALAEKPDVILIQFGHNDSLDPSDPHATDAATDFRANLRRFIDSAREARSRPILITPMRFLSLRHGEVKDCLGPYAEAMRAVAAEKKAPLIDLFASSTKLYISLGEAGLARLRSDQNETAHINEQGAEAIAKLVAHDLPKADPRLGTQLRSPASIDRIYPRPSRGAIP